MGDALGRAKGSAGRASRDRGIPEALDLLAARLREQRDPQSSDQPVERLVNAMDALGYQPQRDRSDDARVVLRPCPFLNLAGDDPDVICRLHVGLANGLLGPDQPWRVTDIEPFATPTTCVLRLQHLAAAEPSAASDHVA